MTIFLIGFMGAGKTTVGKKLAAKLGYTFVDLDLVLESNEKKYIRDIIADHGELYFREKEAEALRELGPGDKVIATGGGTPCFYDNMQWMKAHGKVVYLNLAEAAIYSRLKTTNLAHRPLLRDLDDDGLRKFIQIKLEERQPYYMQADIVFDALTGSVTGLAELLKT